MIKGWHLCYGIYILSAVNISKSILFNCHDFLLTVHSEEKKLRQKRQELYTETDMS